MALFTRAKAEPVQSDVKLVERVRALELEIADLTAEMTKFQRDLSRTMRKVYRSPADSASNSPAGDIKTPNFPQIPGLNYPMGGTD